MFGREQWVVGGTCGLHHPADAHSPSNAPRQYTPQRVVWDDEGRWYAILRVGNAMLVDYLFLCDGTLPQLRTHTTTTTPSYVRCLQGTLVGEGRMGKAECLAGLGECHGDLGHWDENTTER